MTLVGIIQRIAKQERENSKPMGLVIGTVVTVNPLSVKVSDDLPPIPASQLYLDIGVIEKYMTVKKHDHIVQHDGPHISTDELDEPYFTFYENGKSLPTSNGKCIVNEALKVGDKVRMTRVEGGQKFIVESKLFHAV